MAADDQVVFLSLHGEDVPQGVVNYLTTSLKRSGIRILQHKNEKSEDRRSVLNKIRESSFVLFIFSVGFAKLVKCMDELAMVKKRMNIGKLRPIPVYYKLDQEDVVNVQGLFGSMLHRLETEERKTSARNMDALLRTEVRLRNWREALVYVTATSGSYYQEDDGFIKQITEQVNTASARDDEPIGKPVLISQIKERMPALVSRLGGMGLQFDGNISEDSDSLDKLYEQLKKQLNDLLLEETKKKEDNISIPVYEKSPMAHTQVFISFRGADTRHLLISYLFEGLRREGIKVYKDVDINKGSLVFENISQVMREVGIALVIFSEHYAESKWCLNELMVIKRNMDEGMLKVVPVFFKVRPHDVMRQKGMFGHCFRRLAETVDEATVLAWREALQSVGERLGVEYSTRVPEIDFIMDIVAKTKQLLANASLKR